VSGNLLAFICRDHSRCVGAYRADLRLWQPWQLIINTRTTILTFLSAIADFRLSSLKAAIQVAAVFLCWLHQLRDSN
jgi:hypothetical protein